VSMLLFLTIFVAINLLYILLGAWSSQGIKDNDDYFLAGRTLGVFALTLTLIATQLGSNFLLVSSAGAYKSGLWGLAYPLGMSLGFLILGSGFASKLRAFNVQTTAQLFQTVYLSQKLRMVASVISIASLWGILLSLVIASKILLASIGLVGPLTIILFWATLIVYTVMGGFKAVVLTDIYQVIMITIIFSGLLVYGLFSDWSGGTLVALLGNTSSLTSYNFSYISIVSFFIAPALFSLIEQDLAQRFFAAKTRSIAVIGALLASLFLTIFAAVPIYFGLKARALGLILTANQNPLIVVMELISHPVIAVLGLCAIAAALTSTADSVLCAISSHAAQDFSPEGKNSLRMSRFITFIVGISAVGASYTLSAGIGKVLVSSYQFSIATLFVPIFACFIIKKPRKGAALGSIVAGIIGFFAASYLCPNLPIEVPSLIASALGFILGSLVG
jgi:solute:Na+ symporter, SSS family